MFQVNNKDINRTVGRFLKLVIKTTDWCLPEVTAGGVLWKNVSWNTSRNSFENTSIGDLTFDKVAGLQLFSCFPTGLIPSTLLKEAPTQVLPCEFCEISKNSFFDRTRLVAASVNTLIYFFIRNFEQVFVK